MAAFPADVRTVGFDGQDGRALVFEGLPDLERRGFAKVVDVSLVGQAE